MYRLVVALVVALVLLLLREPKVKPRRDVVLVSRYEQIATDEANRLWRINVDIGRPPLTFVVTANAIPSIPSACIIGMTLEVT